MPQDMPPVGGYEAVQYKRNLPARGFRPATYLAIMGGIMAYGFYRVGQGIREHKYGHRPPSSRDGTKGMMRGGRGHDHGIWDREC